VFVHHILCNFALNKREDKEIHFSVIGLFLLLLYVVDLICCVSSTNKKTFNFYYTIILKSQKLNDFLFQSTSSLILSPSNINK
jgi:hypothetical protein